MYNLCKILKKSIKRSEIDRKLFLISRVKAFSDFRDKFEKLFKSIKTLVKFFYLIICRIKRKENLFTIKIHLRIQYILFFKVNVF